MKMERYQFVCRVVRGGKSVFSAMRGSAALARAEAAPKNGDTVEVWEVRSFYIAQLKAWRELDRTLVSTEVAA